MFINILILVFGLVTLMTGCATSTIDLTSNSKSEESATITAAARFYLFWGYECNIQDADHISSDSTLGAKKVKAPEGLLQLKIECFFNIANPALIGHVYFGNLSFLAQAGHEYTVLFQNMRKCIVVIDEENNIEVDSDCNLTGYRTPY